MSFVLLFVTRSGILGGFCHLGCFLAVFYSSFLAIWEKSDIFGFLLPFWPLYGCFRGYIVFLCVKLAQFWPKNGKPLLERP